MEEVKNELKNADDRLTALLDIARWLWIVNAVVMVLTLVYGRFDIAILAGFTALLALVATAVARRAAAYLRHAEQTIHLEQS